MSAIARLRRLRSPDERPLPARTGQRTPELASSWTTVPPHKLTRGLGEEFVVSSTVLKRYHCHATAHAAVKAVRELQAAYGLTGPEVEAITVTERMVERHSILEPADLTLAQYSIPFCLALILHREAGDPESFDAAALRDPQIRSLCRRVRLVPEPDGEYAGMGRTVTIALSDGRRFESRAENGMLEPGELEDKFRRLTRRALGDAVRRCSSNVCNGSRTNRT